MKKSIHTKHRRIKIMVMLLPFLLLFTALSIGSYKINFLNVLKIIWEKVIGRELVDDAMARNLIWQVRFPRVMGAALVGAGLSVSGAVFQGLFKNPLASPDTLGVSNGAGFGAGLAIVLSLSPALIQIMAIFFGLVSVSLTFLLSVRRQKTAVTLILSGMLVGSLFSSLLSLLKFMADPFEKLPAIVFWLMGSLAGISYEKILWILPVYIICMIILFLFRWKLNVMSIGDVEAKSFGVEIKRDRGIIIFVCSVLTALVVSISGIIGWVGIIVPHLSRMLVGSDFRKLLPVSASFGICYLLVTDTLCRTLTAAEIPIGVLTGIIGILLFLFFTYRRKVVW
jgi:iron complex transport system permease protein